MHITGQIYAYPWRGRGNNCNSYLFKGEKTVLFDPGHIYNEFGESGFDLLARHLAGDGFALEDVDLILCTHGHPDHVEAAGLAREKSGAPFALHQQDEFILEALKQRLAAAGNERFDLKPDFYLQEGDLELGSGTKNLIRVIHTPGHSPGSVCFYLPEHEALISGDTIFENSIGRYDLPGGDIEKLEQSVARLAALEKVELLLPGHMGFVSGADNVRRNFERIRRAFFGVI